MNSKKSSCYPYFCYKVNHFPKSYELTRKDLMNRNVSKMAIKYGNNNFNFVPKTYLIPSEMPLFLEVKGEIK